MPGPFGFWEILIIMALLLLVFGARRLPEMGRSLGSGMREFKDAVTGKETDEVERPTAAASIDVAQPSTPPHTTAPPPHTTAPQSETEHAPR
jgi:sec-independent protein translocase protein TatA